MRTRIKLSLLLVLFLLFVAPITIYAQSNRSVSEQTVILGRGEVVNRDYFNAGRKVVIDGVVNGDAYIAGGEVDINGTINGDLLVAGGEVIIRGNVSQNIRAIGGSVLVEGVVGRNVTLAGGALTIDKGARVEGNAVAAGGTIEVLSQVDNLTVAGGETTIQSSVVGDVTAAVGTLQVFPGAMIGGDLTYWSDNQANVDAGASIQGKTVYNKTNIQANRDQYEQSRRNPLSGSNMFFTALSFISSLVVGLLLLKFLPLFSQKTADVVLTSFWRAMFIGFLTIVATPFLIIILCITVIGFPIAMLIGVAYALAWYMTKFFVALAIGSYIAKVTSWKLTQTWSLIVGLSIYYILGFIPFLGGFVKLVILFVGMGSLIMSKKALFTSLREKKLV